MRRFVIALSACLWACGDNRPGQDARAPFETAPHAPLPIVFPHTGTVLANMQLVTVTFDGYPATEDVESFGDALVDSEWYSTIGSEYRLSGARHAHKARIAGGAPSSLNRTQIAARILDLIARGQLPRPTPVDNQTLYLVYVPSTVTGSSDLRGLHGYHEMLTYEDARFPIAVVLDQGNDPAMTTAIAAHQLIDAVTNPYEPPRDGYYTDPPMTDPWSLVRGEIADLCEGEALFVDSNQVAFPRVYSSAAAQAGMPPCKPAMPGDNWSDVTAEPSQIQSIPAGGSVRFTLTGWSTTEMASWKIRLRAAESSNLSEDEMLPQLNTDTINNQEQASLILHAPREAAPGTIGAVYILSGDNNRPWPVAFRVREP